MKKMARLRYLQNKRSGAAGTISKATNRIYFYDDGMYVYASADGVLNLISDTTLNIEGTTALNLTAATITLTGAVTVDGNVTFTGDDLIAVTVTDPTSAVNAIYGYIDAGGAWTSGNMVALRGKVAISGSVNFVSATGVWAGLDFATSTGSGSGLTCALNAEVSSNNATKPNAIIYIQSLPATNANFATVPYIAFTETGAGTGSNILFSLGHAPSGTGSYVTTGSSGNILYHQTIHISANGSDAYIPYSTVEGTFTTAYPIVTSNATAIDFTGAVTKGLDFADATLAFDQDNAYLAIGTWSVAKEITLQTDHFVPIQVNLESKTSVAKDIAAARFRVNTGAANTLTAVNVLELRSILSHNVGQHANLQVSTNVTGSITSTGETFVGYFSLEGTGVLAGGNVSVLKANSHMNGAGCDNVGFFTVYGTGATVTNVIKGYVESSGTATNILSLTNVGGTVTTGAVIGGTMTTGLSISGTMTTGISIGAGSTTGISIGACSSAGINSESSILALKVVTGQDAAMIGRATISSELTDAGLIRGIVGYVDMDGDCTLNHDSLQIAGVHGQVTGGATYTEVSDLSCVWADNQIGETISAGTLTLFRGTNNGDTEVSSMINLWGTAEYFLIADGAGAGTAWEAGMGADAGTEAGHLLCKVGGKTRKIRLYELA